MRHKSSILLIAFLPILLACALFSDLTNSSNDTLENDEPPMTTDSQSNADADVTYVRAVQSNNGSWTFHVTVAHPDTGWEDYANGWDVVLPDDTVILPDPNSPFTRLLLHPHETEQPFTRSQSNIIIPDGITQVTVRAHDLVDGWGGQEITVDLTLSSGEGFEVDSNND